MPTYRPGIFTFGDAYKLMKYQDKTAQHIEWLWNSRDGVTPFSVLRADLAVDLERARSTRHEEALLMHAHWHEDVFIPNFVPPVGMRIFVDLSMERARQFARQRVAAAWTGQEYAMKDDPVLGPLGRDGAAAELAKEIYDDGRRPDVVVVDAEMYARFATKALSDPWLPEGLAEIATPAGTA